MRLPRSAARRIVIRTSNDSYPGQDYGNEQLLAKEWRDELVHQAGLRRNGFAQLTRSRSGVGRRYASPSTPLKL